MTTDLSERDAPGSLRDRQLAADRSGSGTAAWSVDGGQHVRLWDVIDQSWTSAIPVENSRDYLDRRVMKCSQ